ncbi:uncharacterized protein LOC126847983 [Adelges cooleyi]|uniref:uncharacterized protein LOC126847983 n=1 Tax=Adelges cooleyi TaxID=133065 RepID=UPI0021800671|nr:uncharacterized protein LOC126847983 [Adelges cooleyi]XP_050444425.1 uncharacterized protein LOC126847983 [Adelges cooleyi]
MMFFIAIVAVFFGGVVTSLPADKQQQNDEPTTCNNPQVMNCKQFPLFNYTDFPVVVKKEDFVDNCPYKNYEKHLVCVDSYTRHCMTPEQRKTFYKLYNHPTMVMQEICEAGPYQDEYLKHAPCLKTVHKEYEECGNKHQNNIRRIMDTDSSDGHTLFTQDYINNNLKHLCGSFRGYLQCVHNIVKSTCGDQTVAFTNQFLNNMASSLLNLCEQHSIDMQIESNTSRSSRTTNPLHGSLFVLLVGLLLLK